MPTRLQPLTQFNYKRPKTIRRRGTSRIIEVEAPAGLAVDASSPARVTGATTNGTVTVTTATFDPPAAVLVATCESNARTNGGGDGIGTGSITNNGAALTWTKVAERNLGDSGGLSGYAGIFVAPLAASRTGMTVTLTMSATVLNDINSPSLKLYVVTGADMTNPVGTFGEGSSTTNNLTTTAITTVGTNSLLFAAGCDFNALGTPTSSDLILDPFHATPAISGASGYKLLGAPGSTTANLDAGGATAAAWNYVVTEIRAPYTSRAPFIGWGWGF